ncbi:YihY/virulence factor BrkB family protein [Jiella sp. M17.18]|uniref:YihY/virulence factor BrkB family protein n=1 Tax=Jiella sp. M17.18 TaxID=3234247 RepID=UPI0034DF74F0
MGQHDSRSWLHEGWDILVDLKQEVFSDHMLMVASGLAFHGIVALMPVLASIAVVWTMIGGLDVLKSALDALQGVLPDDMLRLARSFVSQAPSRFGLGIGLAINFVIVLWTAWRSASGLITALNIMADEPEKRSRVRRGLTSFAIAIGGTAFLLFALTVLAAPALLPSGSILVGDLRWPILAATLFAALAILFRVGPSREQPRWAPLLTGAGIGTALWLAVSYGLTVYVSTAGSYGQLYGPISSVVLTLIWFYVSALTVLTGAELDAMFQERVTGRRRGGTLQKQLREREKAPR